MPIDIGDRYKLILEEHRFASEFRFKIVQGWCLTLAACAAAYGWVYAKPRVEELTYAVSLAALISTIVMWVADLRHRKALQALKTIGVAIENDRSAAIPESQRYFVKTKIAFLSHGLMIDLVAGCAVGILAPATWYLSSLEPVCAMVVVMCVSFVDVPMFAVKLYRYLKELKRIRKIQSHSSGSVR